MTMDKRYRDRPIREIEALVATQMLLRQFKLYSKDKQPVAFLTWASASDAVTAKVEARAAGAGGLAVGREPRGGRCGVEL